MNAPETGRTAPLATGFAYPECPRWRAGALYFSDQHAGTVYRMDGSGSSAIVLELPSEPAGLGWDPQGRMLVVSMRDRALLRMDGADLDQLADLATFHPGLSNELVVDDSGRAYVGNIGFDFYGGAEPRTTCLVMVADGVVEVVADGLLVPNGMVISPDGRQLIVAESFAHRLTRFTISADGRLGERSTFADLVDAVPDGICLDTEGAVWFASIGAHEVVRVTVDGRFSDRISTGEKEAIACTLGGDDGRTLFVCTSGTFDPARTVVERSGAIETVRVAVPGAGSP